ncbi:MAG: hypothetical protein KIS78_02900 [Labilithrix sp.]|nr:hypothetical protein [Labilithrix sp.]
MTTVAARRVRARDNEHGRCSRDDQVSDVRDVDRGYVGSTFGDVDATSDEVGDDIAETRSLVLPATSFGESLRRLPSSADHLSTSDACGLRTLRFQSWRSLPGKFSIVFTPPSTRCVCLPLTKSESLVEAAFGETETLLEPPSDLSECVLVRVHSVKASSARWLRLGSRADKRTPR